MNRIIENKEYMDILGEKQSIIIETETKSSDREDKKKMYILNYH